MSEYNIFRPATVDEKREFIELTNAGSKDIIDMFMEQLASVRTKYLKSFSPYDAYSCRIDFEEAVKRAYGDVATAVGRDKQVKLPRINFEDYGKSENFDLVEVLPVVEDKLLDGIRNSVQVGKNFIFRAKKRGNSITIYVPNIDLVEAEKRLMDSYRSSKETKSEKAKKE